MSVATDCNEIDEFEYCDGNGASIGFGLDARRVDEAESSNT